MFFILFLLFTTIPVLEIYLLFQVGGEIGILNTISIVILTGIVGAWLAKREGRAVFVEMNKSLQSGKEPTDLILQGFLVFAGGLLLLTPGFVTDILGFSFVFPGTRHAYIGVLKAYFKRAVASGTVKFYSNTNVYTQRTQGPPRPEDFQRPNRGPNVIDVESERIDD